MLMEWWMMDAPPMPMLVLAGMLLAIASNRNKRIRVSRKSSTQPQPERSNSLESKADSKTGAQADSKNSPRSSGNQNRTTKNKNTTLEVDAMKSSQEQGKRKWRSPVLPQVLPSEPPSPDPISFTIKAPEALRSNGSQE